MHILLVSPIRSFEWIPGLGRQTRIPIPRLRFGSLGRLLFPPPGELHTHEDEDKETRESGCDDVGHRNGWIRCAVEDSPTDFRMLSHFASSTSVLRSPSDPIVLLYMDWDVYQDGVRHGHENIIPR